MHETPTVAISVTATILAALSAAGSDTPTGDSSPSERHVYKTVDGRDLAMEIYRPTPTGNPRPGIIFLHGGGWREGALEQFRYACHYFAGRGMVAATVDYRMQTGPKTAEGLSYKAICITDAKSAIRWLKVHATEFDLDPRRLAAGGGSAGGHIAVLATNQAALDDPQDPPGVDTAVVAYVLFNPAFSPTDKETPEVDVASQLKPTLPPTVMFFGTQDADWKPGGDAFAALIRQRGATLQYWLAENQRHGFFNMRHWRDATLAEADRFLVQQKLLSGEPTLTPERTAVLTQAP